jgi:hypothetical protein
MPRSGKLAARIVPVAALDDAARDAMWDLYARHYDGVDRAAFLRDLSGKRHVIVARDSGDSSLQGFSTLTWTDQRVQGRRFVAVFSGDTIVAPEYWGQSAIQSRFGQYISRVRLAHPHRRVYWFLITKGYKTYLLLTRNFPQHWPRHGRETPAWERAALDALARERFGAAWRPDEGVIRFDGDAPRLKDRVAPLDDGLLDTPDVRFFQRANPGHARGDELACIARVSLAILPRYLLKQVRRRASRAFGRREWTAS